jgi:hypothetical protein
MADDADKFAFLHGEADVFDDDVRASGRRVDFGNIIQNEEFLILGRGLRQLSFGNSLIHDFIADKEQIPSGRVCRALNPSGARIPRPQSRPTQSRPTQSIQQQSIQQQSIQQQSIQQQSIQQHQAATPRRPINGISAIVISRLISKLFKYRIGSSESNVVPSTN